MRSFWLKLLYSPLINRATYKVLDGRLKCRQDSRSGRFCRAEIKVILNQVWSEFETLSEKVPREETVGGRMNIQLACLTLSAFRILLTKGIKRDYSIELMADIAWKIYRQWGVLVFSIAKIFTRKKAKQMEIAVNSFLKFPFSPPAYIFERPPASDGVYLDMLRCPIAEYLEKNQATDLCIESWCNLDFALAEMWGGKLERQGTLAMGCDRCDFKFKIGSKIQN